MVDIMVVFNCAGREEDGLRGRGPRGGRVGVVISELAPSFDRGNVRLCDLGTSFRSGEDFARDMSRSVLLLLIRSLA